MPDASWLTRRCARLAWAILCVAAAGCSETSGSGGSFAGTGAEALPAAPMVATPDSPPLPGLTCLDLCGPALAAAALRFVCPAVVASEEVTGPCTYERCPAAYGRSDGPCAQVQVVPTEPGLCHIAIVLEGGVQFATDIMFASMTTTPTADMPCSCNSVGPTQGVFDVDDPTAGCDAGVDAPDGADATAAADGAIEAAADGETDATADGAVDAAGPSEGGSVQSSGDAAVPPADGGGE